MFCRKNVNKIKIDEICRICHELLPKNTEEQFLGTHILESIFRAFKRKEMKASHRLVENDIITRGVTVKIQQVAVRRNYENPSNDAKGEDE